MKNENLVVMKTNFTTLNGYLLKGFSKHRSIFFQITKCIYYCTMYTW